MNKKNFLYGLSITCLVIVLLNFILHPEIVKIPLGILFIMLLCLVGGLSAGLAKKI